MNTKALRQKVLDLAIHGKLVPQNPNDESATVLLEKIRAEKAEKIKKGELKADKKDSFIFVGSDKRHYEQFADGTVKDIEDEIPFEVPDGWAWCRLGELFYHTTGKALKKSNNKGSLRKYITTSNLYWNKFDFTEVREMYFTDDELDKCTIKKGDLVLCNGGDVGRAAIWNYNEDICYQNHVSRLRPKIEGINNSLYLYLLMFYKEQGMLNGKGVGITSLSANDLLSAIFPLPPLNEQNSIVTSIENIFEQIEHLDQEKSDLQTIIKQTKSKILDLAIHGKLVPQDPNDEPAEELLKRIVTSDNRPYEKVYEEPFDIPDSWRWVKLTSICNKLVDGDHNPPKSVEEQTEYIMASSRNINYDRLDDLENVRYLSKEVFKIENNRTKAEKGDIFFTSVGTIGRSCIYSGDYNICFQRSVTVLNTKINNQFLKYFFDSNFFQTYVIEHSTGTAQMGFYLKEMANSPIAIPPMHEQARIVDKVSELFYQLDQIQNNLI